MKKKIVIATIKSWNLENANIFQKNNSDKYDISIIDNKEKLTKENLDNIKPDYIFFPHWSWLIKPEIHNNYNCILFHMTDLPFGRGGSPLQNLIMKKIYDTKISAIKVVEEMDAGDIYLKHDVSIKIGNVDEIFSLISDIIFNKMIPEILEKNIIPLKQNGQIISFKRRKPEDSDILKTKFNNINDIYDFIRMLDGEGYPNAFIHLDNMKISFSEVHKKQGKLFGRFEITYDE